MRGDDLDRVLSLVSNPTRRKIIRFLSMKHRLSFSELMEQCGLDIFWQCGLMNYHLKVLAESGVLEKSEGYELTDYGRQVASFSDSVQKMKVGGKTMEGEIIPNLEIERFEEKHVEPVAKVWMKVFGFDEEYRGKALDHFRRLIFGVKGSACFVAVVDDSVVGFLEGEHTRLGSFYETYGELGYIHGSDRSWITDDFKDLKLKKYVLSKLVEAFNDYFKAENAYGLFSPDISPEMSKFDPVLKRVLMEQEFHVQNIRYQMRKDFKRVKLKGADKTRLGKRVEGD